MAWHRLGQFKIGPQNNREVHLANVYTDTEFIDELKKANASHDLIAKRYAITVNDIKFYLDGHYPKRGFYRARRKPFRLTNVSKESLLVEVDINITKEDFSQIWKQVISPLKTVENDGKFPKYKPPLYDKLLYAIFKARQNNKSFVKIFNLYSANQLPYFTKTVSGINSEQKLKDYYYEFGPKTK